MVYGTYNYSYLGLINQIITGGPHVVVLHVFHLFDYRAGMSRATTSRRPRSCLWLCVGDTACATEKFMAGVDE